MGETLEVSRQGQIAVITLCRPEQLNTMNSQMHGDLDEAVSEIERDAAVRAFVITGSGRSFCAGGDIGGFTGQPTLAEFEASAKATTDVLDRVQQCRKASVAAINGLALGGGLELALACDLRVCVSNAKLGVPEIALGFLPGGGGTARLTRMLAPAMAKQLLLTGQSIGADEALRIGLVNAVTDDAESCLERALAFADRIASMPPLAVAAGKRLVDDGALLSLPDAITMEREVVTGLFGTEDRVEGVAAFFDKRPPVFRGR